MKACCFHIKAGGRAGKRGILNHAPLKTAYSSGSKSISSISKPKIILISASLIRPFNSIYPGNREFFEVEEDIQFILENYYSEKELLKEFNFLLKDIFGIAMYDSGDKKIIALKIKNYLDEMFRTNITNQLLAARFGFVPSYIVSIFKTYYGLTPMDYLVKTRIDESKFLLTNSSLKIKEVANEVGYEDSLYFSKVFKKITGVSPKEYIRSEKIDS